MKSKYAQLFSTLIYSLVMAVLWLALGSKFPLGIFLAAYFAILVASVAGATSTSRNRPDRYGRTPRQRYQPRQTDAGNWLEAPVAELDKSTCGKLLASRLRRKPELHVVVRPETPKVCNDGLYDPELDGQ